MSLQGSSPLSSKEYACNHGSQQIRNPGRRDVELGSSICMGDATSGFLREAGREESPLTEHPLPREGSLRELSWF